MSVEEEAEKLRQIQQAQNEEKRKVVPFDTKINFIETAKGGIKANSINNVYEILLHDKHLKGLFAFNEFTHEIEVSRNSKTLLIEKGQMKDAYTSVVQLYIEQKYKVMFASKLIDGGITTVSRRNVFNPAIEYFEQCLQKWDGKKRVADFLPVFLGVEPSEVTTLQTKLFFVGAVAKTFKPETKFDFVLDLVGGQGVGKTTLLKKMANGWYTDQFTDFENKDNFGNMMRALIVNDDEMTATSHSSFEILKKFSSAEKLEFRAAYTKNFTREYKNFVMARTTNEVTYLKDKTGERRFLPVMADKSRAKKSPVTDLPSDTIDQLWGEFTSYYKDGFEFGLTESQENMLARNREQFMYIDEIEIAIDNILPSIENDYVSSKDIAFRMGDIDITKNRKVAQKIKSIMDNRVGWEYVRTKVKGKPFTGYHRLDSNTKQH